MSHVPRPMFVPVPLPTPMSTSMSTSIDLSMCICYGEVQRQHHLDYSKSSGAGMMAALYLARSLVHIKSQANGTLGATGCLAQALHSNRVLGRYTMDTCR